MNRFLIRVIMKYFYNLMNPKFIFLLFFVLSHTALYAGTKCEKIFSFENYDGIGVWKSGENGFRYSTAGGITVTGEPQYDRNFTRKNLGLNVPIINSWKKERKKILLLGEGYGSLLPLMIESGIEAKALDLWYGAKEEDIPWQTQQYDDIISYLEKYKPYLIAGSALELPESVERPNIILSHQLVNNINPQEKFRVIDECLRVIADKGEIRLFGFDFDLGRGESDSEATWVSGSKFSRNHDGKETKGKTENDQILIKDHLAPHPDKNRIKNFRFVRVEQTLGFTSTKTSGYLLIIEMQ